MADLVILDAGIRSLFRYADLRRVRLWSTENVQLGELGYFYALWYHHLNRRESRRYLFDNPI